MDGTGPGSCSLSALALRMLKLWVLLPKCQLYFGDVGCGDNRWVAMAQDPVRWQALALTMLNLWVLLSNHQMYVEVTAGWTWLRVVSNGGL